MPAPFVILGGGPCGLAAAWDLARKGLRPLVLEREHLVGGLCATHERNGWRFDLGGHRFVSADAELSQWLEGLLGSELLTPERKSVVLHGGRTFAYPLEAASLIANLGVNENLRALAGYGTARLSQHLCPRRARSFEDWVVARFGRPLYDTFFGPYTQKLWGIPPNEVSADWAAERISLLNLGDAFLRMLGARRATPIRSYARRYRYPRLGMGQLYEVIAADIVRLGGEVRTGAEIVDFEVSENRVHAVHVARAGSPERVPVGELLSPLPLPNLVRGLGRSQRELGPIGRLRFRALVFLNLMLRRRDFSENTWMYVASGHLQISRIQEPKRRSPAMAPDGRTSLMLEIPCNVGDSIWTADVDRLRRLMDRELAELGYHVDDVLDAFAVRIEHGYPIYHLDYEADRQALLGYVDRFVNVRTAGRQGLFRYVFMDAAMQMGRKAAAQMVSGRVAQLEIDAIGRAAHVIETRVLTA